ncbi:hypothetical protein AND_003448 [Anopheles darlingi]|uniref:Uncharacterized protein n=1 Tax=Anopheles darlingi TaxID=43151 RepID=W5JPI8_ANODA|nr:hypothetical protein AND_003448 [Anopheles darlingi]
MMMIVVSLSQDGPPATATATATAGGAIHTPFSAAVIDRLIVYRSVCDVKSTACLPPPTSSPGQGVAANRGNQQQIAKPASSSYHHSSHWGMAMDEMSNGNEPNTSPAAPLSTQQQQQQPSRPAPPTPPPTTQGPTMAPTVAGNTILVMRSGEDNTAPAAAAGQLLAPNLKQSHSALVKILESAPLASKTATKTSSVPVVAAGGHATKPIAMTPKIDFCPWKKTTIAKEWLSAQVPKEETSVSATAAPQLPAPPSSPATITIVINSNAAKEQQQHSSNVPSRRRS